MRTFRDAACLVVAVGSLVLAVCQPFDATTASATTEATGAASPTVQPATVDTVQTTVDRAIRFSPGLKV